MYSVAAELTASSPCSNVPIQCPICPKSDPTIWKIFMKIHFEDKHKLLLTKHEHLWKLSNFERVEKKKIWLKRAKVTVKRTKKANQPPLVVSEKHCVRIPSMYLDFISNFKGSISNYLLFLSSETTSTRKKSPNQRRKMKAMLRMKTISKMVIPHDPRTKQIFKVSVRQVILHQQQTRLVRKEKVWM